MKQSRLQRLATLASGTAVITLAGCNSGSNVKTAPTSDGTLHINAPPEPTKVPPAEPAEAGVVEIPKVNAPTSILPEPDAGRRPPRINAPPGNP